MTSDKALQRLATFDPELAHTLAEAYRQSGLELTATDLADLVETIFLGYRLDMQLGATVAEGYHRLLARGSLRSIATFGREIRQAAEHSVGLTRNLARLLPHVLLSREADLWDTFQTTLATLLAKGEYLVKAPLEGLFPLASAADGSARAYLELLQTVFGQTLSYNRCQYLGNLLPRAVGQMPAGARTVQIRQLLRLVRVDLNLIEPYLEGLSEGLAMLSPKALQAFVDQVLDSARQDPQTVRRFLALRSERGRSACRELQTAVVLNDAVPRLNRYLRARTGQTAGIRPFSAIRQYADQGSAGVPRSATDGLHLYLPDIVDTLESREANARLLTVLAKFEAGLLEFGTFTFDLERAFDLGCLRARTYADAGSSATDVSDFTRFSRWFDDPRLALNLFTVFEHARLRLRLAQAYPGLLRNGLPLYQTAMRSRTDSGRRASFLDACYGVLALDLPLALFASLTARGKHLLDSMQSALASCDTPTMRVEHAAGLTARFYDSVQKTLASGGFQPPPFAPPYRWPLLSALIDAAGGKAHEEAGRLAQRLRACGVKLYRGDLRQQLLHSGGRPTAQDILRLACPPSSAPQQNDPDASALSMTQIPKDILAAADTDDDLEDPRDVDRITWLKEWNAAIGDYLHAYVRVRDRRLGGSDTAFYDDVLQRCEGLVRRIRRSFELLRPEGLGILRPWVEGDDFDYRALLDFVVDRRSGRQPSERLYIKRVKQRRDVAVMLLVDLSRSTSNMVSGSSRSVLDVAKEAIVLFTQALEVVGDRYAVAGFSGTGRLGVDFFRIKDFAAPLDAGIKGTISRLTPQRSTRMGAAVRRATLDLMAQDNRVRLLLLIGDGFPNDTDYKDHYAIQDTRQAIAEAHSSGIITQAITVNLPTSPRLDELYGPVRHTVISNVQELPDKLLRLYGVLTRA
jgi:nitric oxide reductase NorD protein